ncbi:MAG: EAL domain-containing protein [Gammaproteobacteria bacterium]|nr:EAL domain-containing protein [Gammaproteobacteria bacterium]
MLSDVQETRRDSTRLKQASWLVLLAGVLLSLWSWMNAGQRIQTEADLAFEGRTRAYTHHLMQVVDHHMDVLISFQAMFRVNGQVDLATFEAHHHALQVAQEYPALLAVQYAPLVTLAERDAFLRRMRQRHPDYRVAPEGERAYYVPVTYNLPMAGNQAAFGYDMAFEPVRRRVMEDARDSGRPQVSPPIRLIQGGKEPLAMLVRLPLYRHGAPVGSESERRAAFNGVVSGVIRISDLVAQAGQDWSDLHLRIDDTLATEHSELFDSARAEAAPAFKPAQGAERSDQRSASLTVGSRHWTLTYTREPVAALSQPFPLALLIGGLLGSGALFALLQAAATRHARAAAMADHLSQSARGSEARLRSVVDHTIDGILTVSPTGNILSVNQAVCRIFGHSESAMLGQHLGLLLPGANEAQWRHGVESFLQSQPVGMAGLGRRTEGQRANGQSFPLDLAISCMEHDGAKQYIGIVRDLSAQQAAERAIVEAHKQLNEVDEMRRVIVHNAPYAIFVLNLQGVIQTVNPAGERLLGFKANELVGRCSAQHFFDEEQLRERATLLSMRLGEQITPTEVLRHLARATSSVPTEWVLHRKDGSPLVAELLVTEISNEFSSLTGYVAMAYDVTSRREAEDQVQHMAMHDALTALPNRNMLQEQLRMSLVSAEREQRTMGMMFLDLDRFKKINDTLGHHIGDSVIIEVGRRLREAMRTSDIVARLGGDEFVILLTSLAEAADGERVAAKLLELFVEPIRIGPHELRVTPSIGLALYPAHGTDAITLMRHADLAMYQAKNKGRNRVQVYSDQMDAPSVDTLVLENDLYHALERQELRLHFQPQFDCRSGHITGAEALLRWEHNGRLVPPSEFIPLAEETGLIVPMGEWVLRQACETAQRWREFSGWPLRIAVNLSALQLDRPDLIETVSRALRDTGLPPTALELEITESIVVRESLRAADVLAQLRALGVGIAIDDFGVGYSSFAYLRELPVDRFKLDRSFLSSVPQSQGDSRLVAALIAMGHRLEVGIVAEGVETEAQAQFLRDHGCDEVQGYHLGRPMPAAAFADMLEAHARAMRPVEQISQPPAPLASPITPS